MLVTLHCEHADEWWHPEELEFPKTELGVLCVHCIAGLRSFPGWSADALLAKAKVSDETKAKVKDASRVSSGKRRIIGGELHSSEIVGYEVCESFNLVPLPTFEKTHGHSAKSLNMKTVELAIQGKHEPFVLVKLANPELQLKVYTRYDVDAKRTILPKAQVLQEKQP
eukprot:6457544-Amphidinium_carterae.3